MYQPLSSCIFMHGLLHELLFECVINVVIESVPLCTLGLYAPSATIPCYDIYAFKGICLYTIWYSERHLKPEFQQNTRWMSGRTVQVFLF